jgi:hypothetical protein
MEVRMTIATLFLILALVLFVVAAIGFASRINLTAAGLALVAAALLVPAIG